MISSIVKLNSCFLLFTFMTSAVNAQLPSKFFDAVKSENFELMFDYMSSKVNLTIDDVDQLDTRKVAVNRIKGFMRQHKITSISTIHKGSDTKSGSEYKVAKLSTDKGPHRLFVYAEKDGDVWKVKEVRISKEK